MNPLTSLQLFSWVLIIVLLLTVFVPYLLRRAHLLTTWNLFLVGSICFVGVAGLDSATNPTNFQIVKFQSADYFRFITGAFAFFAALYATYYWFRLPRAVADVFPRKWPPSTGPVLFFALPFVLLLATLSIFPPPIIGLAQFAVQIGNKAIVFAVVLAFVAWYRQRVNLLLLAVLLIVAYIAVVYAALAGSGRRTLMGVLLAVPICMYWIDFYRKTPLKNLIALGVLSSIGMIIVAGYSEVRHFDRIGGRRARDLSGVMKALQDVPSRLAKVDLGQFNGQHAVQFSLTSINLYTGLAEPQPFHSLWFVFSNPWPRALWPTRSWGDKPEGLGLMLPRGEGVAIVNWGPGIVGHGYHEGGKYGPLMLVFYGFLAGSVLRYFDELLMRQPDNPYLLGALAAMAGHLVGWTRGDIGVFTIQIIGSCLIALILCYVGRLFFGTGVVYPRSRDFSPDRMPYQRAKPVPV